MIVNYMIVKRLCASETICNLAYVCRTELWGLGLGLTQG